MKMKLLLASLLTIAGVQATASVGVLMRSDFYNLAKSTDTANADVGSVTILAPTTARLNFDANMGYAKINVGLNFRSFDVVSKSYSVAGTQSDTFSRALTVDKFVETAFISRSLGMFEFSSGKIETNIGGYERGINKIGDDYQVSLANGSTVGLVGFAGAQLTTVAAPDNSSGAEIGYMITPEHSIALQIVNQSNSAEASISGTTTSPTVTKAASKRLGSGLQYEGSFADKMVSILAQYHNGVADTVSQPLVGGAITNSTVNTNYTSLSAKVNLPSNYSLMVESFSNSSLVDATAAKKNATTSNVVTLGYHGEMIHPILSIESSENKIAEDSANASSFKRTAYSAAIELTPKSDEGFRYHLAYNTFSDAYGAPVSATMVNQTVTNTQVIAGIKYSGDFLK